MGDMAAVAVITSEGYSIGIADRDIPGHTPTTYSYDTYDDAHAAAKMMNERLGLTPQEASDIVLSTMSLGGVR